MTSQHQSGDRERAPTELMAIDLGMIVFVTVLIAASHMTLGRSARLVPLIVGYPTLALILFQFMGDVGMIDGVRRRREPDDERDDGLGDDLDAAMHVLDEDAGESGDVDMRRYAIFGLWSIGFVLLAYLTSFLVAVPVALFVILRDAAGGAVRTLSIVVPTSIVLYLIFDTFLQIPW